MVNKVSERWENLESFWIHQILLRLSAENSTKSLVIICHRIDFLDRFYLGRKIQSIENLWRWRSWRFRWTLSYCSNISRHGQRMSLEYWRDLFPSILASWSIDPCRSNSENEYRTRWNLSIGHVDAKNSFSVVADTETMANAFVWWSILIGLNFHRKAPWICWICETRY